MHLGGALIVDARFAGGGVRFYLDPALVEGLRFYWGGGYVRTMALALLCWQP